MVEISYSGLLPRGTTGFDSRITDLEITEVNGTTMLFSVSGYGAGVSAYRIANNGAVSLVDQQSHAPRTTAFSEAQAEIITVGGEAHLVTALHGETGLQYHDVSNTGSLPGSASWASVAGEEMRDAVALASYGDLLYVGRRMGGLSVMTWEGDGSVRNLRNAAVSLGHLVSLEIIDEFAQDYLIGASASGDSITSWRINGSGQLYEVGQIGMEEGLGIATPSAMTVTVVNGVPYVIAAGSGSSSLSVLAVGSDGSLSATDHILDGLDTRFGGVTELASVTWEGHSFVVAGGADDGLSLFLVMPGGKLMHLDSIADETNTPLENLSGLAVNATANGLQIFATSESERGLGMFDVDLSDFGVIRSGSRRNDTITGGADDDILVAGDGQDFLRGGGGADTFVIMPGDGVDTVGDYRSGTDIIDLSFVPMLYSMEQVNVISTSSGAILVFRNMEVVVRSATGGSLDASDITINFGTAHMPTGSIAMRDMSTGSIVNGTARNDRLHGSDRDDILRGLGGNDVIFASGGGDEIDGGAGRDTLNFRDVDGRVLIDLLNENVGSTGFARFFQYGHASGDTYTSIERFVGGDYADNLRGGDDNDALYGEGVSDRLYGRSGNDTLDGGTGADAIYGNRGADVMTGGPDEGRRDRFIYFNDSESGVGRGNRDIITDFTPGEDRIELSRLDANLTRGGKQSFTFIGSDQFSGQPGELRAAQIRADGITLIQADLDGDGTADFEIELTGLMRLDEDDFLL